MENEEAISEFPNILIYTLRASISFVIASVAYGMAFAFTGTFLPLIRDYIDEEKGTWLGAQNNSPLTIRYWEFATSDLPPRQFTTRWRKIYTIFKISYYIEFYGLPYRFWPATVNVFAMIFGAYLSSGIKQWCGFKKSIIIGSTISIFGWMILSVASDLPTFMGGCALVGFGGSFNNKLSACYLNEIPERGLRGVLSVANTAFYALGILLGHLSTILVPWRLAMKLCSLVPFLSIATVFLAPDSFYWLLTKSRTQEAQQVFFQLRRKNRKSINEFNIIVANQRRRNVEEFSEETKIFSRKFLKPFLISSILFTAVSGSGYDVISVYIIDMLSKMTSNMDLNIITILFDIFGLVFSFVPCFLVKKMSRRGLFFTSALITILTLLLLIAIISYDLPVYLLVICLCSYTAAVNIGVLPLAWLILAEIYGDDNRDRGMGVTIIYYYVVTFAFVKVTPMILRYIGIAVVLGIFASMVTICSILLYFIMLETKKLTLQEIELALQAN